MGPFGCDTKLPKSSDSRRILTGCVLHLRYSLIGTQHPQRSRFPAALPLNERNRAMHKRFSPRVVAGGATTVLLFALCLCGDWRRPDLTAQEAKDPKTSKEAGNPAATVNVTPSRVAAVTVYPSSAMVTREVDVPAGKGTVELTVSPLPPAAILSSLYTEGTDGIRVLTTRFRTRPVVKTPARTSQAAGRAGPAGDRPREDRSRRQGDPGEPQDAHQDGRLHGRVHDPGHGKGRAQQRGRHRPGQVRQGIAAGDVARAGRAGAAGEGQSGQGRACSRPG